MGHAVPNLIGVDHTGLTRKFNKLIPDYMVMGERGMSDMAEMEMPIPDNTAPMMAGEGPFGSVEMGACSVCSKSARVKSPETTKTQAGSSTQRVRWPMNTPDH